MTADDYRRPHQLEYGDNPVRTWPLTVARAAFVYGVISMVAVIGLCLVKWLIPRTPPSAAYTGSGAPVMLLNPLMWIALSTLILNLIFGVSALLGTIGQPLRRVRQLALASLAMGIFVLVATQTVLSRYFAGVARTVFELIHFAISICTR
jgi:hypothetical protein